MELTRRLVEAKAEEYERREPLYPVEQEHVDLLPAAFADGDFGWRDAEWVVRWYYRRSLGEYPDDERRRREERFAANEFETLRETIDAAVTAEDVAERLASLTTLDGVDVPVASAFLLFIDPETSVVLGPGAWSVLRDADALDRAYPDPPSARDYEAYLDACRSLADRFDCDTWTLYRALWRLRGETEE